MNNLEYNLSFFEIKNNLIQKLRDAQKINLLSISYVVLMNDFVLDRIIQIQEIDEFIMSIKKIYKQKGGSYPFTNQINQCGGNAANCAKALGNLGVNTYFIGRTDPLGTVLLKYFLHQQSNVNIDHVQANGSLATTTALEMGDQKTNVMINDLKSFSSFGFSDLTDSDLKLMEKASLIGVFDWTLNKKGTELASGVFDFALSHQIPTYFDTADPSSKKSEVPNLFSRALQHPGLTYFSINENELHQYTNQKMREKNSLSEIIKLSKYLKSQLHAELEVHTSSFSASVNDKHVNMIPSFNINPLRATGSGDNWNAGNILGILLNLEPAERLLLANSTACFYISSENPSSLSFEKLITYIKKSPPLKKLT